MAPTKLKKQTTSDAARVSAPIMPGPGAPIEIVFTFDTTGSMYGCLTEVRQKMREIVERLFADIPNLRIAVVAHGDYCDACSTYVTKYVDFTNDVTKLCNFIKNVKGTGGGDWEECYELVLRQSRELLSWQSGSQRALVMIGDAIPHPPTDPQNKDNIDWKEEAAKLRDEMGVRVYAVQAYESAQAKSFWQDLAKLTLGKHLKLNELDTIVDMMMAICYREHGAEYFEAYEREVRAREGALIRKEYEQMFDSLRDTDPTTGTSSSTDSPGVPKPVALTKKTSSFSTKVVKPKVAIFKPSKKGVAAKKVLRKAAKMTPKIPRYSLGKQYRETVRDTDNMFSSLPWTRWRLAMAPDASHLKSTKDWAPRRKGDFGLRRRHLFREAENTEAVYELAVQVKDGSRKYPLCLHTKSGHSSRGLWDTNLVRSKQLNAKVTAVLRQGCKLYVRRAAWSKPIKCGSSEDVNSLMELRRLMRTTYNYAWSEGGPRHMDRKVVREGVTLHE